MPSFQEADIFVRANGLREMSERARCQNRLLPFFALPKTTHFSSNLTAPFCGEKRERLQGGFVLAVWKVSSLGTEDMQAHGDASHKLHLSKHKKADIKLQSWARSLSEAYLYSKIALFLICFSKVFIKFKNAYQKNLIDNC